MCFAAFMPSAAGIASRAAPGAMTAPLASARDVSQRRHLFLFCGFLWREMARGARRASAAPPTSGAHPLRHPPAWATRSALRTRDCALVTAQHGRHTAIMDVCVLHHRTLLIARRRHDTTRTDNGAALLRAAMHIDHSGVMPTAPATPRRP
jgi:hypothetical protein